jgi:hypothetical protein
MWFRPSARSARLVSGTLRQGKGKPWPARAIALEPRGRGAVSRETPAPLGRARVPYRHTRKGCERGGSASAADLIVEELQRRCAARAQEG